VFHFGGHWFDRGIAMAEETRRAAGAPEVPIRRFPWFVIYLLAPFVETLREMIEMRYLWNAPLKLDNRSSSPSSVENHTRRSTWRCARR
jgi:hypothetical protein